MQFNSLTKSLAFLLLGCAIIGAAPARAQKQSGKPDKQLTEEQLNQMHRKAKLKPPEGVGFYIAPITETPGRFSFSFTNAEGHTVSGMYVRSQVDIIEAIMTEAKRFAETAEAVGDKRPIITRLSDKNEPGFFIDVAKMGVQSQFFITVRTSEEVMMLDGGTIKRGNPKSKAFLYDMLSRLQDAKNASQALQ